MPGWYLDLLISDELEGQFQIASIRFLIENRKDAEPLFRRNNRLRDMIEENYSRKDWESQIAELLKAILTRDDCNEEIFSYWFLGLFQNNQFVGMTHVSEIRATEFVEAMIETTKRKIRSSLFFADDSARSYSSYARCRSSRSCRQI